jgi:hypothetical protein
MNLEVVWHGVELIDMVILLPVTHINHLAPLLRQLRLNIPQPSTNKHIVLSILDQESHDYIFKRVHLLNA